MMCTCMDVCIYLCLYVYVYAFVCVCDVCVCVSVLLFRQSPNTVVSVIFSVADGGHLAIRYSKCHTFMALAATK